MEVNRMLKGKQSILFDDAPYIISSGSIVGKKEGEGPLGNLFDQYDITDKFTQKTWEKAESKIIKETINNPCFNCSFECDSEDKKQCIDLINSHEEFIVLSHEHPDGDTLGCAFALCEILRSMGKKRVFRCADAVAEDAVPGDILVASEKNGLYVKTGDGVLELTEIQMPNQKRMNAKEYLRGHKLEIKNCR